MQRKAFCLFLSLLLATALVALAQSPTSSAPNNGTSSTQQPYGATLDHPNPNSANEPSSGKIKTTTAPAGDTSATSSGSSATTTTSGSTTGMTDNSASTNANDTSARTLPRTASELPLLAALGLLALFGALVARTFAKRDA